MVKYKKRIFSREWLIIIIPIFLWLIIILFPSIPIFILRSVRNLGINQRGKSAARRLSSYETVRVKGLEKNVIPILEKNQVTAYSDRGECLVLEYNGKTYGHVSGIYQENQKSCFYIIDKEPAPFDNEATKLLEEISNIDIIRQNYVDTIQKIEYSEGKITKAVFFKSGELLFEILIYRPGYVLPSDSPTRRVFFAPINENWYYKLGDEILRLPPEKWNTVEY